MEETCDKSCHIMVVCSVLVLIGEIDRLYGKLGKLQALNGAQ